MEVEVTRDRSIGFCGFLTLIFITLKLIDKIDWSWWWVLGPLWIPIASVLFVLFIVFIGVVVSSMLE